VVVVGGVGSIMVILMIYVAFAQFFLSNIEGNIPKQYNLSFLILGLFFISLLSTIIVSLLITQDVQRSSVLYCGISATVLTIITMMVISYISLFIYYPSVFEGLAGFEYVMVLPLILVYFAIYLLPAFFYLFIIQVVVFYVYFTVFFEKYYKEKEKEKRRQGNYL
jgi:hypothetical protein